MYYFSRKEKRIFDPSDYDSTPPAKKSNRKADLDSKKINSTSKSNMKSVHSAKLLPKNETNESLKVKENTASPEAPKKANLDDECLDEMIVNIKVEPEIILETTDSVIEELDDKKENEDIVAESDEINANNLLQDQKNSSACLTCGESFTSKTQRLNHLKNHKKKKKCFSCETLISSKNFSRHVKNCLNITPSFSCSECDFVCNRNDGLQRHIKIIHNSDSSSTIDQEGNNIESKEININTVKEEELNIDDLLKDDEEYDQGHLKKSPTPVSVEFTKKLDLASNILIECPECHEEFQGMDALNEHKMSAHVMPWIECSEYGCPERRKGPNHMQVHRYGCSLFSVWAFYL